MLSRFAVLQKANTPAPLTSLSDQQSVFVQREKYDDNWRVEVQNSSIINRASEISDISFAWIIVNSQESITVPCATKNRVLINQWGRSRVKSGVDAASFWSFLAFFSLRRTMPSPLINDYSPKFTHKLWWGRYKSLWSVPVQKWKCIPHVWTFSRLSDRAQNAAFLFIPDSNIPITTMNDLFLCLQQQCRGFDNFPLHWKEE